MTDHWVLGLWIPCTSENCRIPRLPRPRKIGNAEFIRIPQNYWIANDMKKGNNHFQYVHYRCDAGCNEHGGWGIVIYPNAAQFRYCNSHFKAAMNRCLSEEKEKLRSRPV